MGMFDDIKCKYPLPLAGANDLAYQTKDTDAQYCDLYEIRENGTLWHEDYDTEDQSDAAKWEKEHPGKEAPKELDQFCGCMAKVNKRWVQVPNVTGEICFYTIYSIVDGKMTNANSRDGWLEWSAYFVGGKLNQVNLVENRLPEASNDRQSSGMSVKHHPSCATQIASEPENTCDCHARSELPAPPT